VRICAFIAIQCECVTDRQTHRLAITISCSCIAERDKNVTLFKLFYLLIVMWNTSPFSKKSASSVLPKTSDVSGMCVLSLLCTKGHSVCRTPLNSRHFTIRSAISIKTDSYVSSQTQHYTNPAVVFRRSVTAASALRVTTLIGLSAVTSVITLRTATQLRNCPQPTFTSAMSTEPELIRHQYKCYRNCPTKLRASLPPFVHL